METRTRRLFQNRTGKVPQGMVVEKNRIHIWNGHEKKGFLTEAVLTLNSAESTLTLKQFFLFSPTFILRLVSQLII